MLDLLSGHGATDVDDKQDIHRERCKTRWGKKMSEVFILDNDTSPFRLIIDTIEDGEQAVDAFLRVKVMLHFNRGSEDQFPCCWTGCHLRLNHTQIKTLSYVWITYRLKHYTESESHTDTLLCVWIMWITHRLKYYIQSLHCVCITYRSTHMYLSNIHHTVAESHKHILHTAIYLNHLQTDTLLNTVQCLNHIQTYTM